MWKNKIKKTKQAEPEIMEGLMSSGNQGHDGNMMMMMMNNNHDLGHNDHDEEEDDDDDLGSLMSPTSNSHSNNKRGRNDLSMNDNHHDSIDSSDQQHSMKRGRGGSGGSGGGGSSNAHEPNYAIEPPTHAQQQHQQQNQQQQQQQQSPPPNPPPALPSQPTHYPYEGRNLKISKRDQNWDVQFEALLAYANKHKHCNVRTGYTGNEDDKPQVNLYAWLALQRRHKKQNKLRLDREKKLQTLVDAGLLSWAGSETSPRADGESGDPSDEYIHVLPPPPPPSWDSHFYEVLIYAEIHGHANIPLGYLITIDKRKDIDLGAWLEEQRKLYIRKGLQIDIMNPLNPQNNPQNANILKNLAKLNILAEEGRFSWQAPRSVQIISGHVLDIRWSHRYDAMRNYINQGDGNQFICLGDNIRASLVVPVADVTLANHSSNIMTGGIERFDLGLWVLAQRKCYAAGILDERRKKLLQLLVDSNQFTWQSKEEIARIHAEEAKKLKEEEALWNAWYNALVWQGNHVGHCNLESHGTITLPDGSEAELGKWLHIQRSLIKKGKLRLDRAQKIKKLYDEGKLLDAKWGHLFTLNYPPGSFEDPSKTTTQQTTTPTVVTPTTATPPTSTASTTNTTAPAPTTAAATTTTTH